MPVESPQPSDLFGRSAAPLLAGSSPAVDRTCQLDAAEIAKFAPPPPRETALVGQLGRYQLLEQIGQGGMGSVYKAFDPAENRTVAIKVLGGALARHPDAVRRFTKEARLLAQVNNPYVTNLYEVGEDRGLHYLVLEFVAGRDLQKLLRDQGPLDEISALTIMADVARGLFDAHRHGILHRDIKPENILLTGDAPAPMSLTRWASAGAAPSVKLSDFGLARHVEQTESLELTQAGTLLGTPLYMAPQQCMSSGRLGPEADVYALGATLFHLLSGRPPFQSDDPLQLAAMHCFEQPPALGKLVPELSEPVVELVERCLAKHPSARFADAGQLLDTIERLLSGEMTGSAAHPALPNHDPKKLLTAEYEWDLAAPAALLWPHVANTDRVNAALGMPPMEFVTSLDPQLGVRRFGKVRMAGMTIEWEEHPFEWIEGRQMGVLRRFSKGPFEWLISSCELVPQLGGGTRLTHRMLIAPRGLVGRAVSSMQIRRGGRSLDQLYRRIDAVVTGKLATRTLIDPFAEPKPPGSAQRRRLEQALDAIAQAGVPDETVQKLGDFVVHAAEQDLARIRPLALARRLALDAEPLVAACLRGAQQGLFTLGWDVLCPTCRVASEMRDTLRTIADHAHCDACNLDFAVDFANSVELIVRVHPQIRSSDAGNYCVGGPWHAPHVVAQVRLAAGERLDIELALSAGEYVLRGPQIPTSCALRVTPESGNARGHLRLGPQAEPVAELKLRAGKQTLTLLNGHPQELLVGVERTTGRLDVLSAARAAAHPLFRELFPHEILAPGQLLSVAHVALLAAEIDDAGELYRTWGDARSFARLQAVAGAAQSCVQAAGGVLLRSGQESILAVFDDAASALRAALSLRQSAMLDDAPRVALRIGLHRGAALVTTRDERLDYSGGCVHHVGCLARSAAAGEIVLSRSIATDPAVAELLSARAGQAQSAASVRVSCQPVLTSLPVVMGEAVEVAAN